MCVCLFVHFFYFFYYFRLGSQFEVYISQFSSSDKKLVLALQPHSSQSNTHSQSHKQNKNNNNNNKNKNNMNNCKQSDNMVDISEKQMDRERYELKAFANKSPERWLQGVIVKVTKTELFIRPADSDITGK